jgi:hypothetical protein
MSLPIEDEYEYRFTKYEYEFDASATGDQREVSLIASDLLGYSFR